MRLLVTAGNTQAPIDSVRCITNIFTGRTGARLAHFAAHIGYEVVLLTSHPDTFAELVGPTDAAIVRVVKYRTFDDLRSLMQQHITGSSLDVIIHCAAVSDYLCAGVFAQRDGAMVDLTGGRSLLKVKSDEPEMWLRLVRAPKLVDLIRIEWGFKGVLVKFKLEVGKSDDELVRIAERSRTQSAANLMVANTLEEADRIAFLGPIHGQYEKLARADLPQRLFEEIARHG